MELIETVQLIDNKKWFKLLQINLAFLIAPLPSI